MNLINKEVTHKHFGKGSVVKHNDSIIEVHFATESKKFVFPDAFGKYLKLHDKSAAHSLEKVIQKKEMEREKEEQKREEEKNRQHKEQQLRLEHQRLMKNHKLHPQSQMAYWCDKEENNVFTEWKVFTGEIKSGNNKGKPKKPTRLYPNSVCLLTSRDSSMPETDRRIIGVYMVNEEFIGKFCEDGYISAHSEYKLELTEQESERLPFWKYCVNEKSPHRMTWNTGKYRYFDNIWMAQILQDIASMKSDTQEQELAQNFFEHYCRMNQIRKEELPEPNGALLRM